MGYSINKFPFVGATDYTFNFSNGYLSQSDVYVYVTGDVDTDGNQIYREYDWLSTNQIRVVDISDLTSGVDEIVIHRIVSKTTLGSDYEQGEVTRNSLQNSLTKLLMIYQEILDGALGDKVDSILLPVNVDDAITFIQDNYTELLNITTISAGDLQQVSVDLQGAVDSAVAAAASEVAAQTARAGAESASSGAISARNAAQAAQAAAETARDVAVATNGLNYTVGVQFGNLDRTFNAANNTQKRMIFTEVLPKGDYTVNLSTALGVGGSGATSTTRVVLWLRAYDNTGTELTATPNHPFDQGLDIVAFASVGITYGTVAFNFTVTDDVNPTVVNIETYFLDADSTINAQMRDSVAKLEATSYRGYSTNG